MAHSKWDLKAYQRFLNAFSLVLALTVALWVGFSQLNFAILILCIGLGLTAILGLAKMKRTLFTFPFFIFAIIILYDVVNESSKELIAQTTLTLQFLTIMYVLELGNSTIQFNKIFKRMREPAYMQTLMVKALRKYFINLSTLAVTSSIMSISLLTLGSVAPFKPGSIFAAAALIIVIIATLFLTVNMHRHSSP